MVISQGRGRLGGGSWEGGEGWEDNSVPLKI